MNQEFQSPLIQNPSALSNLAVEEQMYLNREFVHQQRNVAKKDSHAAPDARQPECYVELQALETIIRHHARGLYPQKYWDPKFGCAFDIVSMLDPVPPSDVPKSESPIASARGFIAVLFVQRLGSDKPLERVTQGSSYGSMRAAYESLLRVIQMEIAKLPQMSATPRRESS